MPRRHERSDRNQIYLRRSAVFRRAGGRDTSPRVVPYGQQPVRPGDIRLVTTSVGQPNDPFAGLKSRPVVLIRDTGDLWRTAPLTTLPRFKDGNERTPVPNPAACGLGGVSYLWGSVISVPHRNVGHLIGRADEALIETMRSLFDSLTGSDLYAMRTG